MDLHFSMARLLSNSSTDVRKRSSPKVRRKAVVLHNTAVAEPAFGTGSLPRNLSSTISRQSSNVFDFPVKAKSSSFSGSSDDKADEWHTLLTAFAMLFSDDKSGETSCPTWRLVDKVRELRRSYLGDFLYEFFESKILPNEMGLIRAFLEGAARKKSLLEKLGKSWDLYYRNTLPKLQLVMSPIKTDLSVREVALRAFRDHVVLELQQCGYLEQHLNYGVTPAIKQMFLVLQTVHDNNISPSYAHLTKLVVLVVPYVSLVSLREKRELKRNNETEMNDEGVEAPKATPLTKALKGHQRSRSDAMLCRKENSPDTWVTTEQTPRTEKLKSALAVSSVNAPVNKAKKKTHFRSRSDFTLYTKPDTENLSSAIEITVVKEASKPPIQPPQTTPSKKNHSRSKSDFALALKLAKKRSRSDDK